MTIFFYPEIIQNSKADGLYPHTSARRSSAGDQVMQKRVVAALIVFWAAAVTHSLGACHAVGATATGDA
jgi:hypothetical protein